MTTPAPAWNGSKTVTNPDRHAHCLHWQEGDGDCHDCGALNWCPDEGVTLENERTLRLAWETDPGSVGAWEDL